MLSQPRNPVNPQVVWVSDTLPGLERGTGLDKIDGMLLDYSTWLKSWGASPATVHHRMIALRSLVKTYGPTRQITCEQLQQWLSSPELAPWSRRTYFNHVKSYYGWMVETGRREDDPTKGLRRPMRPQGLPRPLSDDEVDQILDHVSGNVREWVLLGMYAGLRAHEIAKLQGRDVTQRTIHVIGKGGKEAFIPTHPEIWAIAQTKGRGWWYPSKRNSTGHVTGASVSRMVSLAFLELGIEGSIHRARHTYGTRLLRAGVNLRVVQKLMRHSSLATTELYLAVDDDEQTTAIRSLRGAAAAIGAAAAGAAAWFAWVGSSGAVSEAVDACENVLDACLALVS